MNLIDKAEALEILELAEHDAEERDWRSGANEIARIRKRIAALPARGVGVTWHPFDTAPRDGSRFLAQGGGLDAIDICSYNARVGCWDCGAVTLDDTDHEPEGYNRPAQWMPLAALTTDAAQDDDPECTDCGGTGITYQTERRCACQPTNAAHVNETPKSEHDAGNVLTAAQAREAAARLLLDMLNMRNGAHEGVEYEEAQKMWDAASDRHGFAAVGAFLRSIIGEART